MDEANPKDLIGVTKPNLALIPPAAMLHEAMAMGNGAEKYGAYNWRQKKVRAMIYIAAAQRHLASYLDGEEVASDSGVHHLGHARACLGIILDAMETGNLIDDRPTPGAAAALIERLTTRTASSVTPSPQADPDRPTAIPYEEKTEPRLLRMRAG